MEPAVRHDANMAVLSVVSWNVLADPYVRPEWFPTADRGTLRPGARHELVAAAVASFAADVVALQEVTKPLADRLSDHLAGWDVRWCPKGRGRPDGCLTAVSPGLQVVGEDRVRYADGVPVSGHVAHVVQVRHPGGAVVAVASSHWRYAASPSTQELVGVRQMRQLLPLLDPAKVTVVAGDVNDEVGGPVRAVLAEAGFVEAQGPGATSLFMGQAGPQERALDVVAVRGASASSWARPWPVAHARPSCRCPSDHVPVGAHLLLPDGE